MPGSPPSLGPAAPVRRPPRRVGARIPSAVGRPEWRAEVPGNAPTSEEARRWTSLESGPQMIGS